MGKIGDYSRWFPANNVARLKIKHTQKARSVGNQMAGHLFDELGKIDIHVHNLYKCYLISKSLSPEQAKLFKSSKCMNPKMSLNVLKNKNRRVKFKT